MKRVILESPYAGDIDGNVQYAQRCARWCALHGESIIASHLIFPQFLDEQDQKERDLGIEHGLAWLEVADYSVFWTDRGWSKGMMGALDKVLSLERLFRLRSLDKPVELPLGTTGIETWLRKQIDVEVGIQK